MKYSHVKTCENIVSRVKSYFLRIFNYKIVKFLQIYTVN